jgi:hypothetical protein
MELGRHLGLAKLLVEIVVAEGLAANSAGVATDVDGSRLEAAAGRDEGTDLAAFYIIQHTTTSDRHGDLLCFNSSVGVGGLGG